MYQTTDCVQNTKIFSDETALFLHYVEQNRILYDIVNKMNQVNETQRQALVLRYADSKESFFFSTSMIKMLVSAHGKVTIHNTATSDGKIATIYPQLIH